MASFDKAVRDIAKRLVTCVQEEMAEKEWLSAYLDARGGESPDSQLLILRIVLPKGRIIKSVKPPTGVGVPLDKICRSRSDLFSEKWFGIKITVFPDGKSETEFNHDPNCVMDPKFLGIDD